MIKKFDISVLDQLRNLRHDTDRLIVAYYPPGSGGKFVLNCLALSRHMVLQDARLAEQQLAGDLTPEQKLKLLLERLDQTEVCLISDPCSQNIWKDLNLGCVELFGDCCYKKTQVTGFDLRHCKFHPVIPQLAQSDLYFACVANDIVSLSCILARWPRAKVIRLTNATDFLMHFRDKPTHHQILWRKIRGPDWPEHPPNNLDQYRDMQPLIHQELRDFDSWEYFAMPLLWKKDEDWLSQQKEQQYHTVTTDHPCWIWNVDCFTVDRNMMLHQLEKLYVWLGMDDFDSGLCSKFHVRYIELLDSIRIHEQKVATDATPNISTTY